MINYLNRSIPMPESFPCMVHPILVLKRNGRLFVEARYFAPIWDADWHDNAVIVATQIAGSERWYGDYIAFDDRPVADLIAQIESVTGCTCNGYIVD
jgi:hypothetical protein